MNEMKYLEELLERYPVLKSQEDSIFQAYRLMRGCYQEGGKLLIAGNGGSCADSEHIVGELMKGFVKKRPLSEKEVQALEEADPERGPQLGARLQKALPALCLTGHCALTTAFANDVDGVMAIAQQVYGYGNPGDVFLGISTSGNSANILYAMAAARARGLKTIALTGRDGGAMKSRADAAIVAPSWETYKIQELHLPIYHALCLMLEEYFFAE